MARLQTAYVAADVVIRPAVFDAARRLGWDLKPSTFQSVESGFDKVADAHALPCAAPTTAGLPFVDSPTGLVLCLAAYFTIVLLGLALQPRRERSPAAKPEDPLWLRLLVLGHNVFLVTLSMYMSLECVPGKRALQRVDPGQWLMACPALPRKRRERCHFAAACAYSTLGC